jgi:hypothetical protein
MRARGLPGVGPLFGVTTLRTLPLRPEATSKSSAAMASSFASKTFALLSAFVA